jgi:hypothetical protein
VQHVDEHRLARQEQLPGAGRLHQPQLLAGRRLLQQPAEPAALVLEPHVPLIGDHRPVPRHHRGLGQLDLQQPGILQRERLAGFDLLVAIERRTHLSHAADDKELCSSANPELDRRASVSRSSRWSAARPGIAGFGAIVPPGGSVS